MHSAQSILPRNEAPGTQSHHTEHPGARAQDHDRDRGLLVNHVISAHGTGAPDGLLSPVTLVPSEERCIRQQPAPWQPVPLGRDCGEFLAKE